MTYVVPLDEGQLTDAVGEALTVLDVADAPEVLVPAPVLDPPEDAPDDALLELLRPPTAALTPEM